jgi:hypothetical protein
MLRGSGSTKRACKGHSPPGPPGQPGQPEPNTHQIEALFDAYADPDDPDVITMEGLEKLCEELGIDPATDIRILVLMWRMGAIAKPGCISKSEWCSGMKKVNSDSLSDIKQKLPALDPGFLEKNQFRGTCMHCHNVQIRCLLFMCEFDLYARSLHICISGPTYTNARTLVKDYK